jgi:glycosyltransferase involved in cell wall biosynthesis
VRSGRTLGCNGARNLGIDRARGRYVAFLDDDDRAAPERLARTVAGFGESPTIGVVCTSYQFIDARGEEQPWPTPAAAFSSRVTDADDAFERLYCDWVWLPTSTFAVTAELLARYRYPEVLRCDGDSILYAQLAASGTSFLVLPDLLSFVCRDDSYTYMSRNRQQLLADRRLSLVGIRRWLAREGITKHDHLHARAWSNHLLREAEFCEGIRGLVLAARALCSQPDNTQAHDYFLRRIRRVLRIVRDRLSPDVR